jgi:hypothetical protein
MRRQLAALAALCAAFALAGPASALDVGVTEDEGNTNPDFVYATLQDLGMTTNVMSIRWDPLDPLGLPANFENIKGAASVAAAHGVSIILATYQEKNTGITDTPDAPAVFAQWLQKVAQECPLCARKVIVLNEPNLQFFFKPTFDGSCRPSSPAAYARVLAAGYDALKALDPTIRVYGLGLSPRGNDNCNAVSNVSMSPVYFLAELGKAYKAMARTRPLMDALSFHPYPNANDQGPSVGYQWPNVGVPNLDRLKQAFYDAFAGTAQPLIGVDSPTARVTGATTAARATIATDEYGIQVETQTLSRALNELGYTESENVPAVTEEMQAEWYADVIARYACDPSVETVNFFHLRDEADRRRFQSGLLRIDGSRRPSYDAVKQAIAVNSTCQGKPVSWRPAKTVIGAKAIWPFGKKFSTRQSRFRFQLTAEERATFVAELVPAPGGKGTKVGKKRSTKAKPLASATGELRAYFRPFVSFKGKLPVGTYAFKVTVVAAMNSGRTSTFTSPAFTVK